MKTFINPQKPSARQSSLYYLPFCPSQAVPSRGGEERWQAQGSRRGLRGDGAWDPPECTGRAAFPSCCSGLRFERALASPTGKKRVCFIILCQLLGYVPPRTRGRTGSVSLLLFFPTNPKSDGLNIDTGSRLWKGLSHWGAGNGYQPAKPRGFF